MAVVVAWSGCGGNIYICVTAGARPAGPESVVAFFSAGHCRRCQAAGGASSEKRSPLPLPPPRRRCHRRRRGRGPRFTPCYRILSPPIEASCAHRPPPPTAVYFCGRHFCAPRSVGRSCAGGMGVFFSNRCGPALRLYAAVAVRTPLAADLPLFPTPPFFAPLHSAVWLTPFPPPQFSG